MSRFPLWLAFWSVVLYGVQGRAQYSAVAAPLRTAGAGFSESIGVGWGATGPNFFFHTGGAGALPPFGGHDPAADAALGFRLRSGSTNLSFNLRAGQGSSTAVGSQTATLVVPHGVPGALFDGRQRPFVTGVIPVVGAGPAFAPEASTPQVISPLAERLWRLRAEQVLASPRGAARPPQPTSPQANVPSKAPAPPKDDPPLILVPPH